MISQLEYAPHPLAKIFPPMSAEELRELADDIGKNGLNDPILLFEDQILDGVHRGKGCVMSGEPPTYLQWDDLKPSVRKALSRAHVSPLHFGISDAPTGMNSKPRLSISAH